MVHCYDIVSFGRRFYRSLVYASDTRFCYQSLAVEPCVGERDGKALGALPLGVALDPGSNPAAPDVLVAHSSNAENGEWMRHVL